jgi:hypothetical protein
VELELDPATLADVEMLANRTGLPVVEVVLAMIYTGMYGCTHPAVEALATMLSNKGPRLPS